MVGAAVCRAGTTTPPGSGSAGQPASTVAIALRSAAVAHSP
ncbi:hypothetical protein [Geodermatophilus saharensis]|nr:hypothetical protein [Geodermatophilus saharensis]